ncbi:MAG: oligopeptide transporter, OPT family [Bacteroidetes bacterium]|nr:oligopeptide transporter, OPT family [Bacteroidota bacterium]
MTDEKRFTPFIPANQIVPEFTTRALILGILMAMLLGAANAYLGLKAGMTIAATYTAAVIGIAVIKAFRGSILEENFARTVGSIGGNVATGAIFTLPAFFIAGIWPNFFTWDHYLVSTAILLAASILGIMFASLIRRSLIDDAELPFPESIAASEIHKSAQRGSGGSKFLLWGISIGALFKGLVEFKIIAESWQKAVTFTKGGLLLKSPFASPAYMGVGYIIGPKLAGINFSGGLLAWGLMAPAIAFFLNYNDPDAVSSWETEIGRVWKDYVRYIAIGGMLVGAFYTLYKMRNNLFSGIRRSFATIGKSGNQPELLRTEKDLNVKVVFPVIGILSVVIFLLYWYFSKDVLSAAFAMVVMLLLCFVFSAVSGYLVGIIGVSSNPTSGLTVSILIIVAFLMLLLGLRGDTGIAAVLGVAAVACASVSVAGEMLQDLKAGHILGCTPWRMQAGDIMGVSGAAAIMFLIISLLHLGDIKQMTTKKKTELGKAGQTEIAYQGTNRQFAGKTLTLEEINNLPPEQQNEILGTNAGFGGENIPAPQASLMAIVAKGIMEARTEWILIITGMLMGLAFILMQVKSPMLISVGMYLPIGTSFAIWIGGLIKGVSEYYLKKNKADEATTQKVGNAGTLVASGLIAGEALIGLLFAGLYFAEIPIPEIFTKPSYLVSIIVMALVGWFMVWYTKRK